MKFAPQIQICSLNGKSFYLIFASLGQKSTSQNKFELIMGHIGKMDDQLKVVPQLRFLAKTGKDQVGGFTIERRNLQKKKRRKKVAQR